MEGPAEKRGKWLIGAMMIAILALALIMLQQQFDEGDHKFALEMLSFKRPGDTWSLGQELLFRSGQRTPNCAAKLLSSFRGTLEVTCSLPSGQRYHFNVDRVRKSIEPADTDTAELFEVVRGKNVSADGGHS